MSLNIVLRVALARWCVDPDHGLTPAQHTWLTTRLAAACATPGLVYAVADARLTVFGHPRVR